MPDLTKPVCSNCTDSDPSSALPIKAVDRRRINQSLWSVTPGRCGSFSSKPFFAVVSWRDVLECPRCHSQMQMIAFITEGQAIQDILASVGLATAPPEVARACKTEEQAEFYWA